MFRNHLWEEPGNTPDDAPGERLLFDLDITETVALGRVTVAPGQRTRVGLHNDEEEIYVFLRGRAMLMLGEETQQVEPGDTVYVPRNTPHQLTCISEEPLSYLYFANWPHKQSEV